MYELRKYTVAAGRMDDLLRRFRTHAPQFMANHGIQCIGFWTSVSEPHDFYYLISHRGDPSTNWENFYNDAAWAQARDALGQPPNLVESAVSVPLSATDFSPEIWFRAPESPIAHMA